MLRHVFRHLIKQLAFVLFVPFLSLNLAVAASQSEQAEKFAQAQELAQKGDIDQAIIIYTSLIEEDPLLPEAYNNLAALYLKKKDTKQAQYILERGLHAHKAYGVLYESLTAINVAMAREAYSNALQIDLKPADITIASLSLNQNKSHKNSPIVISKDTTPVSSNEVNAKAVVKVPPSSEVKKTGEISRNNIPVIPREASETVEKIVQAWSAAWSAQAVDMYLSFYHSKYKPSNGLSRNGWEQSRRLKLKKPSWIKVALSDLNIEKNDGRQAIVKFKQTYKSNRYRDVSLKRMVLLYTDNGWKIVREKSI